MKSLQHKPLQLIELLRFMAAISVLLFHLEIYPSGYKGVDLFFVISGFILFYRYQVTTAAPKQGIYFVHRITKIYLLYWIVLSLFVLVDRRGIDASFLKTILLIPGHDAVLIVSWSLSYELYFYLLFGMWMMIVDPMKRRVIFFIVFLFSTVISLLNTTEYSLHGTLTNFLLGQNFWEFALGIAGGYLYQKCSNAQHPLALQFALLITSIAFFLIELPYGNRANSLLYGILSLIMVYSSANFQPVTGISVTIFNILGRASYAIYLLSPFCLLIYYPKTTAEAIGFTTGIVIVSIFVSQYIEEPILGKLRKALKRAFRLN